MNRDVKIKPAPTCMGEVRYDLIVGVNHIYNLTIGELEKLEGEIHEIRSTNESRKVL